MRKF
ncbi:hypothetical protein BOH78_0598 [Pichia kudriavzevii]